MNTVVSPGKLGLFLACCLSFAVANAQAPAPSGPMMRGDGPPPPAQPFSITRVDPALDELVAPDAKVELMASGFGLTEGPLWVPQGDSGFLIVSGLLDNVLYKITPDNVVSVFLEHAGYTGNDEGHVGTQTRSGRSHVLLIGPSCASLDAQGRVVWCADNDLKIMRLEKDGTRTVMVDGFEGKHFSGPNDVMIRSDGAFYFTDNDFGLRDAGKSAQKVLQNAVWLVRDGKATMVLDDKALGGIPNGIVLSPEREISLPLGIQQDEALRGEARRHARRRHALHRGTRYRRRHEGGPQGQHLLDRGVRDLVSCASPRRRASYWATSICRYTAANRRSCTAPPTTHSAAPTARRSLSAAATPSTRSN